MYACARCFGHSGSRISIVDKVKGTCNEFMLYKFTRF